MKADHYDDARVLFNFEEDVEEAKAARGFLG